MPTNLSSLDDYDDEHFLEEWHDSGRLVRIAQNGLVIANVKVNVELGPGEVGWLVVDRRNHRWALAPQQDGSFILDLHGRTPRQVMEET